ncbi:nuclear transport factor 2 family protein [Silvibacterium sp.]|uniref:nuclear transport factor 2 family protein n=1 Tax=Silvibacterium sp. TaxID=1964179 RepID=UPI0039E41B72
MPGTTKSIDEALQFFLDNLTSVHWDALLLELVADDAVMEFPFAPEGRPQRLNGKREIAPYLDELKKVIRLDEVRLVAMHKTVDPETVILQAEGKGQAIQTGRPFHPRYIVVLTFRDGRIIRWQDYWNPLAFLTSMGATITFPSV